MKRIVLVIPAALILAACEQHPTETMQRQPSAQAAGGGPQELLIPNGDFETGDLSGFTAGSVLGGAAFAVTQGTCFSGLNSRGVTFPASIGDDPDGIEHAVNVRSSGPAPTNSVGILTSDAFFAGDAVRFEALSETLGNRQNPVDFRVEILDATGTQTLLGPQLITTNVVSLPIGCNPSGPPTGPDNDFSTHEIDTSTRRGQLIRIRYRQHTNFRGFGFFTLIDNIRVVNPPPQNQPPVADAGDDQTLECTSPDGASVMLDGTGSSDPDDNIATFEWFENGQSIATGANPTVALSLGEHTLTLRVTDTEDEFDEAEVVVTVRDTEAPSAALHVAIPNEFRGKFGEDDAAFRILAPMVSDACDANPTVVSLTLNGQPVSPGDLVRLRLRHRTRIKDPEEFNLRMEAPSFILEAEVTDASGNTTMAQAAVTIELFANAELDEDEVVPGTGEPGLGVPVDEDAAEELEDHLEDLLDEGYSNPDGVPSAAVNPLA